MPGKPWTPKIVGGTDRPSANANTAIVELGSPDAAIKFARLFGGADRSFVNMNAEVVEFDPLDVVLNPSELLVETTHEALSLHASNLSNDLNPSWHYGPTVRVRDGINMIRGQYVVEYHNGEKQKTYWVPA
jgi:hypothetical protein